MNLIELHILQSFPVTCLNRDDVGAPKSVYFGGVQRARVSSQCWKRAIRTLASERIPEFFSGQRGCYHSKRLKEKLIELGITQEDLAKKYAQEVLNALINKNGDEGSKESNEVNDSGRTKGLLYLSEEELELLAQAIYDEYSTPEQASKPSSPQNKKDKKTGAPSDRITKRFLKSFPNATKKDFGDISIFGRMIAAEPSLTLEGAGMFSHAISTHKAENEVDFFSAVDDTQPPGTAGAGHIGTLEMNSACYYRYVGVNLDLLFDEEHLNKLVIEDRERLLKTFIQACLEAVPMARKNSMFGFTLPECVLGLVRQGQPLSLVNAFEKPVIASSRTGGYAEPSRAAILSHWASLKTKYDLEKNVRKELELSQESPLETWLDTLIKTALET